MRSEERSWRSLVGWYLLGAVFALSLVLLGFTQRNYIAFREVLQGIAFDVRLIEAELMADHHEARLRWVVTVTLRHPSLQIPTTLELLEWHVYSADGRTPLGFYTSGEVEIALGAVMEFPVEARIEDYNFEKLQLLQETSSTTLLFQGMARVMFQLPKKQERKKIPVEGVFTLPGEGE